MKKNEIKVGGLYRARVSGNSTTVRVDAIRPVTQYGSGDRNVVLYDVTNLATGRRTTFRSAAKFRFEVSPQDADRAAIDERVQNAIELSVMPEDSEEEASEESDPIVNATSFSTETASETCGAQPVMVPALAVTTEADQTPTKSTDSTTPSSDDFAEFAADLPIEVPVKPTSGLTQQQQDILAVAQQIQAARNNGQQVLVIGAGAGTGKTFTLKKLEEVLQGRGQYTAFNSSLVAESKEKFKRAACNTTHSLAFRAIGRQFDHRLNGPRVKSWEIASRLGIEDYQVKGLPYPKGSEEWVKAAAAAGSPLPDDFQPAPIKTIKASFLAGTVIAAIRRFCQSDEPAITERSFRKLSGVDVEGESTNSDAIKEYLLPFAQKMWDDLSRPDGTMPFDHDVYVKLWQLGRGQQAPVIAADYILLDEAQDTAPVMLDILKRQKHALLILVGDDNQQIYEWRGAVNAMASFPGAPRRLLSQSFRFGQAVADVANSILRTLDEPTDLVMQGLPSIPTRVCPVVSPRCYLYRTNAGAIGKLMSAMEEGRRGHLIGGSKEVIDFCEAAESLQRGIKTGHPELGCFDNWAEVQEYSKSEEGADLRLMVKLIDTFGATQIANALKRMPKEEDADFVLCTAHKSKGREWPSVFLGQDFPTQDKMTDADRRLIYVAATRAQEELDVTECPTFCGGYSGKDGGEDGEGGSRWIPGIEIAYTAPMPTTEQLAAYRAAKAAPQPTPEPVTAPVAPRPAPAPVARPAAVQAPANGKDGSFTWANMDGAWCVRGPRGQAGRRVTVTRKNGTTSEQQLGEQIRDLGDLVFYRIK